LIRQRAVFFFSTLPEPPERKRPANSLNTPKSDRFQVLIKLKQSPRLAHVPMAVITSSQATSDKYRTGLQGTRYIQKPTQLEEFLTTVGQAVKDMIEEGRASKSP
jgi:CheY-like chemotaxis protein